MTSNAAIPLLTTNALLADIIFAKCRSTNQFPERKKRGEYSTQMRSSRITTSRVIILSHFRRRSLFERRSLINWHTARAILVPCASSLGVVDENEFCGHCISTPCRTGGRGSWGWGQRGSHFLGFEFDVAFTKVFHLQGR